MSISHDTCVFATNEKDEIIFFKSYEYFKQKDEAQADATYAQGLAKENGGTWYLSSLSHRSWKMSHTELPERFLFATPHAKP